MMNIFLDAFQDFLLPFSQHLFLKRALLGCIIMSFSAAPLGVFLLLRRMILVGDAISHGMLPGIAVGFMISGHSLWAMSLGGVVAGMLVVMLSTLAARHPFLTEDAAFSGFYLFSLALGVMLIGLYNQNINLMDILFGSLLGITKNSFMFIVFVGIFTVMFLTIGYRLLLMECFDPVFFHLQGGKCFWIRWGFMALLTLNLIGGFQAMGTFMVLGLLILPALIMRLLSNKFFTLLWGSSLVGIGASFWGLLLSFHYEWPAGPSIVLILGFVYVGVLLFSSVRQKTWRSLWKTCCFLAVVWGGAEGSSGPLPVVVSFSILADIVQCVGGDDIKVEVLVGRQRDCHQYQPTSRDMKILSSAQLVIMNGLHFEPWINKMLEVAYKGPVVVMSNVIKPLWFSPSTPDPHVWHDVSCVRSYVRHLVGVLSPFLSQEARSRVHQRAAEFDKKLVHLDRWIRSKIRSIPLKDRVVLVNHGAFNYYAQAYGMRVYALLGVSTEAEPSAKRVSELIKFSCCQGVRCILTEHLQNPNPMQVIAEETGIPLKEALFSDFLSHEGGPAETYIQLMVHNTRLFLKAFCRKTSPGPTG